MAHGDLDRESAEEILQLLTIPEPEAGQDQSSW